MRAERNILEAEKFRARVEQPGMDILNQVDRVNSQIPNIGAGVRDDDFFQTDLPY